MIGVNTYPGHAFCREEYVEAIKKMVAHAEFECDVYVLWNGNQPSWGFEDFKVVEFKPSPSDRGIDILYKKQNEIRKEFLKRNFTHLFMSESDTLPVEDTLTAFVNYDKDIISSPYFVESQNHALANIPLDNPKYAKFAKYEVDKVIFQRNYDIPCVWGLFGNQSRMWNTEDLFPQRGLVRAVATGIGACLIKRAVLSKVGEFKIRGGDKHQQFTDFMFGVQAYNDGFELFVDTDRISNHLHYDFDDEQIFTKWFNPAENIETANPFA